MGLFDGTGDNGGLMGMYANPQMAGLMGMSQGLLSAAGPSRIPVSMGQALGAGVGGMQQGAGNALQMQQQLMRMQAMQGLMGGMNGQQQPQQPQQPAQPDPTMAQGSPVMGGANTGGLSGLSAGLGRAAPQMPQMSPPQATPSATAATGIYGRTPQQLFQQGMLMNMAGIQGGGDLMRVAVEHDPSLAMQMPTDVQKNAAAAYGYGTPGYTSALQGTVDKGTITSLRPGAPYVRGNQIYGTPPNAPPGFMNQPNADGSWSLIPVQNGTAAVSQSAAAKTAGEGTALPYAGVDAQGNPLPVTNRTAAAMQAGATTPASAAIVQTESNGNPNAVSPKGAQGAWQVMPNTKSNPGFGVQPAQNGSRAELDRVGQDYYNAMTNRYGNPTIGAIAYNMGPGATDNWIKNGSNWEALPQETRNYVGKVSTLTALNSGAGAPQSGGAGKIYAAPPMGATTAANASQGAPSAQMAASYKTLADSDSSYQQSRNALADMITLTQRQGMFDKAAGFLPTDWGSKIDSDVAQYAKAHATFIAQQGGALGSSGTDQSRGTIEESVPTYDKPATARLAGLNMQLNNLDYRHLETQFMTPTFQKGDEKGYTGMSAQFHNTVKPEMMPVLNQLTSFQTKQQLGAAISVLNNKYPQYKKAIDFLGSNGMFNGVGQ